MEKSHIISLGLVALGALAPSIQASAPISGTNVVVWVEDSIPTGAQSGADGGDSWAWTSSSPIPFSGSASQQSSSAAGLHEHYFSGASQTMTVNSGDTLFAAVYVNPSSIPSEIMLQWNDGSSWNHRAYWGNYEISYGANGTAGSYYMGPIPTAGQWTLLTIPAADVGLGGSTVSGMAFSLYGGSVNWDYAGDASSISLVTQSSGSTNNSSGPSTNSSSSSTNSSGSTGSTGGSGNVGTTVGSSTNTTVTNMFSQISSTSAIPGLTILDDMNMQIPPVGATALHILTPNLLEVDMITSKAADPAVVTNWNFVNAFALTAPLASQFSVQANGQSVAVTGVGFKRRPLYAPMSNYDLRIANSIYLELGTPIATNQTVQVLNTDGTLWSSSTLFTSTSDPLRFNPAIHVNQEGYLPNYSKQAMVGYYLGSLGDMPVPVSSGFELVDAVSGSVVYAGSLTQRADYGWNAQAGSPVPYQQVYQADFSSFSTPGQYRLVIPGMGGSMPFRIDAGVGMCFARAYAMGLFHQRCGFDMELPVTRFAHDACHSAPSSVPMPASSYGFTWTTISNYAITVNTENAPQAAPYLTSPSASLFPFVNTGTVNTTGGHHDAGDYSKYTINVASLIHYLMFEVDSIPGVASLDNLGIAESGDGISDVMQEAKWEADYLAKLQDADGGFYFLVYPTDREYESNVTPENGDPQVVWPKTSSSTAAAVAALAQTASSPLFKKTYPAVAAQYLKQAQLGWSFLTNAVNKYGYGNFYQKITAYGDDFADHDELAWAACQIYLATGDANAHSLLLSWFNPADPATWRWGWWHMSESYGHAIRSYAFALQSGRVSSASQLNATFLAACTNEVVTAGNNVLTWSQESAYGTSFPTATKEVNSAGWYFSADQAFDMAVAYQINPNTNYMNALVANMNYEGGCNPVNVSYVTGLGWKRQHGIVSQWELNDVRALPPTGLPIGNIQADFGYLWNYAGELEELSFPGDGSSPMYPFYDRWGDSWNVDTEMVVLNSARGLGALAFLAGQTSYKTQAWSAVSATISTPSGTVPIGSNTTFTLTAPGYDLSTARIVWEANAVGTAEAIQIPAFGQSFNYAPMVNGAQWVEAEAQFPDGRRIFARTTFSADSPNIIWVDDSLPGGAQAGSDGGDSWNWVSSNPTPYSGTLEQSSASAAGEHQVYFQNASATLSVETNSTLYAWIYLNPNNPPVEAMLQWCDSTGNWNHRAYWGADLLSFGVEGVSRTNIGALPATGKWVQLAVPAADVGLAGATVNGLAFTLYGGQADWDCAGVLNVITTSTNTNPTTPLATVNSTAAEQQSLAAPIGTFTINLSSSSANATSIGYTLGGTAVAGANYQVLAGGLVVSNSPLVIPAGTTSATLTITQLVSTTPVAARTVTLTLGAGSGYSLGNPTTASITLPGNTVAPSAAMNNGVPTFSWPSAAGTAYQVFYKNNLTDPSWIATGANVTATGASTSWIDPNSANATQRFYVVMQVQ